MNIVITAGGTSEYIDTVRKITNSGTGRLGNIIANILSDDNKIFYICTPKSIRPAASKNIKIIEVEGTIGLKEAVEKVLKTERIDWFIHSMAVSDYVVDYVSTAAMLNEYLLCNGVNEENIKYNKNILNKNTKISSDEENIVISLRKAPKIIKIIKEISPETKLIGFKLLTGASFDDLLIAAKKLMDTNDCDYVIANDLNYISEEKHIAYILDKEYKYKKVLTKEEIAQNIKQIINI